MRDQFLYDGQLHSPFFVFLREPHGYSDQKLLAKFGLDDYRLAANVNSYGRHAIIANAGGWTMLADDGYYTLWHMKSTRRAIQKLARHHDLYTCSEGDCDRSFDFAFYANGQLLREYAVQSPRFTDRTISKDYGIPLPGEAELLRNNGCNIGIELAAGLGIKNRFELNDLRIYVPSRNSTHL